MRRLIICCDGTWNSEDVSGAATNVWKLCDLIAGRGDDGVEQCVFYQPGVGTDQTRGWFGRTADRLFGGMFGLGLDANLLAIYRWLIREYEPGDELWFFGFSRGAYTARSTVGLIRNCGLLRPRHEQMAERALQLYRARGRDSHPNAPQSCSFRRNYSQEIGEFQFVGVWDTVGSLGVPSTLGGLARLCNRRYQFHDVQLSSRVRRAYHAIAIDERRGAFMPALWKQDGMEKRKGVQQAWFVGAHSDVGGGYKQAGLSDVALQWMIDKARAAGLGIDDGRMREQVKANPLGPKHDSRWLIHRTGLFTRVREITGEHRQFIHPAAEQRLEADTDYEPENLRRAIERGVPRRG